MTMLWRKHSGWGTSKAVRNFSGADMMNSSSFPAPPLKTSMTVLRTSLMAAILPMGPSRSPTFKASLISEVSILAMSSGESLPSSWAATSLGSLAKPLIDFSSSAMAPLRPSASFMMGVFTSVASVTRPFISSSTSSLIKLSLPTTELPYHTPQAAKPPPVGARLVGSCMDLSREPVICLNTSCTKSKALSGPCWSFPISSSIMSVNSSTLPMPASLNFSCNCWLISLRASAGFAIMVDKSIADATPFTELEPNNA
mmetsp:Transcript_163914/g.525688  ORF Transcript_163914/g.525688 Transcript_163914/m.525688 type:complete len:256 (+) Transcript_163914:789-1556(+)